MAKSKKKTVAQLYQEEIKKLKRRIKSYEKKGFFFFLEDIIPEQPKRATRKKVEEIKKLRGKQLALKAEYYEDITGIIYSPEQGVEFLKDKERKRRNKEDKEDNLWASIVVSRWFGELEAFHEGTYYRFMYDSMTEVLRLLKLTKTAEVVEEMESSGNHVTWEVVYREYDNTVYMTRLLDIVQQKGLQFGQTFSDILELRRWYSEKAESFENWTDVL